MVKSAGQRTVFDDMGDSTNTSECLAEEMISTFHDFDITRKQLDILLNDKWLDSHLINYFLYRIQQSFPKCKVLSSFFFTSLLNAFQGGFMTKVFENRSKEMDHLYIDQQNHPFTAGTTIVIPINYPDQTHWILAVVSMTEKKIIIYNSSPGIIKEPPEFFGIPLLTFFVEEFNYRKEDDQIQNTEEFSVDGWTHMYGNCSRQADGINCGVYTILNMYKMMTMIQESCGSTDVLVSCFTNKQYTAEQMSNIRYSMVEICCLREGVKLLEKHLW